MTIICKKRHINFFFFLSQRAESPYFGGVTHCINPTVVAMSPLLASIVHYITVSDTHTYADRAVTPVLLAFPVSPSFGLLTGTQVWYDSPGPPAPHA